MEKTVQNLLDDLALNTSSNKLNQATLEHYAFQHHGKIRPVSKYSPPSLIDIHAVKEAHSLRTNDLARYWVVASKTASKWCSPSFHEKGQVVPASAWQSLLERLELKERIVFKPRYPDIRAEVFSTSQRPTKHEFWQMIKMKMLTKKKLAELSGVPFEKISENSIKGKLEYDGFSFVPQASGRKLATEDTSFTFEEWQKIKPIICPPKIYHPPKVRACVLSKVTNFDVNKGASDDGLQISAEQRNTLAQISLKRNSPYYLETSINYAPPNKYEFLAMMIFIGLSISEMALIMSCTKTKIEQIIDGKKRPSFYEWRRLLEVFNLTSWRNINE
jgi:DNA-binding transcriptional regulator YiaG|tara:strand:+ start:5191 stop:6183 length:993 start_codon:yes stop_codon:yes gene_type:complete